MGLHFLCPDGVYYALLTLIETKTGTKWDLGHTREIPWEMVWSKSARYSLFNEMSLVLFFHVFLIPKCILESIRVLVQ